MKTPEEIESTIDNYLGLTGGTLPDARTPSLAGHRLRLPRRRRRRASTTSSTRRCPAAGHDTLIAEPGTPHDQSWNADDLEQRAARPATTTWSTWPATSAPTTPWPPTSRPPSTRRLEPAARPDGTNAEHAQEHPRAQRRLPLRLQHRRRRGRRRPTNPYDWTQRMAQQHAVLIGGTGYQYGDTDFLEYSERLYLDIARRLHEGPAAGARAAGRRRAARWLLAKQDYLASLGTADRHRPEGRAAGHPLRPADDRVRRARAHAARSATRRRSRPSRVTTGTRRDARPADRRPATVDTPTTPRHQDVRSRRRTARDARPGSRAATVSTVQPGAPALPKQIEDVTRRRARCCAVSASGAAPTPTPRVCSR